MVGFPLFAIGDRLVTIVETSPDCFRYMDCLTDELAGGAFNGTKIPLAIKHLNELESKGGDNPVPHNVG